MMEARFLTSFTALDALAPQWQRWARGIFEQPGFFRAFWQGHRTDVNIRAIAVYYDEILIGIVPLQIRDGVWEMLGAPEADSADILCESYDAARVLTAALALLAKAGARATFVNVASDSRLYQALGHLPSALRLRTSAVYRCPAPARRLVAEDMIEPSDARRLRKRMERFGPVSVRRLTEREEIRLQLPVFFEQHIARSAAAGRPSEFVQPARRAFFEALVENLDPAREFHFTVVSAGEKTVACHAGFLNEGRLIFYKPCFDINFWDFSPGDILLRSLLATAAQQGLEEFDFSVGDEPYKRRFANHERHVYTIHFQASPLRAAAQAMPRAIEHQVRVRPRWIKAARSAKARWTEPGIATAPQYRAIRLDASLGAQGTIQALATLTSSFASAGTRNKVLEARKRLKAGDRFYIVPGPAVCWVREENVFYECWSGAELSSSQPTAALLRASAGTYPALSETAHETARKAAAAHSISERSI